MSDFKDRMIEAIERGWATEATAYDYVRESYADAADLQRKARKENPPDTPSEPQPEERERGSEHDAE